MPQNDPDVFEVEVVQLFGLDGGVEVKETHARCRTQDDDDIHLLLSDDHDLVVTSAEQALRIGLDVLNARQAAIDNMLPGSKYFATSPKAKARRDFVRGWIEEQLRSDLSSVGFAMVRHDDP